MNAYTPALLADLQRSTDDPAHLDGLARHVLNMPPPPATAPAQPDLPVPAPVGAWRRALEDDFRACQG